MTDTTRPPYTLHTKADLETLNRSVLAAFPRMSAAGAELGLALYQQLLEGAVVRREELATIVQKPTRDVVAILEEPGMRCQLLYDQTRSITGFAGLSVHTTAHRLRFGERSAFTWCAWDGLFIPPILSRSAKLLTACPSCKSPVEVSVTTTKATPIDGIDPVMSFTDPDASCYHVTEDSISSFCAWINLFCSNRCAAESLPEGRRFVLLSLDEAFELGTLYNRSRFGAVMRLGGGEDVQPTT